MSPPSKRINYLSVPRDIPSTDKPTTGAVVLFAVVETLGRAGDLLYEIDDGRVDEAQKSSLCNTIVERTNRLAKLFQTAVDGWKIIKKDGVNGENGPYSDPPPSGLTSYLNRTALELEIPLKTSREVVNLGCYESAVESITTGVEAELHSWLDRYIEHHQPEEPTEPTHCGLPFKCLIM